MNGHTCHAFRCEVAVPPRMFACRTHWFALPKPLRDEIWRTYRKGQEIDKRPSAAYLAAAAEAVRYLMNWEAVS